jgi:hypothetical protein
MSDTIVVISTSAPNDRPGYRRDLLKCVCLPNGSPVWFTYRRRWIDAELLQNKERYQGRDAVIVFCDVQANRNDTFHFIPIRYAKIVHIDYEGAASSNDPNAYIAINFSLEGYVRYSDVSNEMNYWQNWITNQGSSDNYPRTRNHPEEGKARFLFTRSRPTLAKDTPEKTSWAYMCSHLDNAQTLHQCTLYRITEIYEYSQKDVTHAKKGVYRDRETRIFETGKTYRVSLQFYLDPGKSLLRTIGARASNTAIRLSPMLVEHRGLITDASIIARVVVSA